MNCYKNKTAEQFVDYLIDEAGLAPFLEEQFRLLPIEEWDWGEAARRIAYLSDKTWQPTPDYVAGLYAMQCERQQLGEAVA